MNQYDTRLHLPVLLIYNVDANWPPETSAECHDAAKDLGGKLRTIGHPVTTVCLCDDNLEALLAPYSPNDFIVFNWCEEIPGKPHSAALVAQALERLGFAFTGADSAALAFSQDKRRVKEALLEQGVPTPRWEIFPTIQMDGWGCFPAIVKPAFEHCSFGITHESVVTTPAELRSRVGYVLDTFQQPALVEDFIDGREFHVSVIGNGPLHALPPAEMDFSAFNDFHDRLCTYDSKFEPASPDYNLIELRLPAALGDAARQLLFDTAEAAYRAIGCRDYARLDIRLREGVFYVLDVNPNADLSPDTSLVLAAELAGFSHGELGSILVGLAGQRRPWVTSDR